MSAPLGPISTCRRTNLGVSQASKPPTQQYPGFKVALVTLPLQPPTQHPHKDWQCDAARFRRGCTYVVGQTGGKRGTCVSAIYPPASNMAICCLSSPDPPNPRFEILHDTRARQRSLPAGLRSPRTRHRERAAAAARAGVLDIATGRPACIGLVSPPGATRAYFDVKTRSIQQPPPVR